MSDRAFANGEMRIEQTIAANAPSRKSGGLAFPAFAALLVILPLGVAAAHAQLRGHGGPVRALAISSDGKTRILGSFD